MMPVPEQVSAEFLAQVLSSSVGQEKAQETITATAASLGMPGRPEFSQDEALRVLATIADLEGLLALTARFARSRLMAKWATEHLKRANGRR